MSNPIPTQEDALRALGELSDLLMESSGKTGYIDTGGPELNATIRRYIEAQGGERKWIPIEECDWPDGVDVRAIYLSPSREWVRVRSPLTVVDVRNLSRRFPETAYGVCQTIPEYPKYPDTPPALPGEDE